MPPEEKEVEEKDLLAGTEPEEEEKPEQDAEDEEPKEGEEEQEPEEETPTADLKEQINTIKETLQEKTEKIEEIREENVFLSKQISSPDDEQFKTGGIYEDLETYYLGNVLLYKATDAQVQQAIYQIENSEDLTTARKRELLRTIETSLAVYRDRQRQYEKQIKTNLENANLHEWQQVEIGFKDAKTGIKGIEKHIPEIWEYCKKQMEGSRALRAKCDASFQAKLDLSVRAIRELGIDKKLGKDLSAKDRPDLTVPVGKSGMQGTKRGSTAAPSFTRKQLEEYAKNPSKVSDKLMAQINKATAEGRIKA